MNPVRQPLLLAVDLLQPIRWAALATLMLAAGSAAAATPPALATAEQRYADWLDANYALTTVTAGPAESLDGHDRAAWLQILESRRRALDAALDRVKSLKLGRTDERARATMLRALAEPPSAPAATSPDDAAQRCAAASQIDLGRSALSQALYACFEHFGNHVAFEGRTIARTTVLELLHQLDSAEQRRALFDAMQPLWIHINGNGEASSPYRRLIRAAAAEAHARGRSPISDAAHTVGATPQDIEAWLVTILEHWRAANPGAPLEPWDYWSRYTSDTHPLDARVPPESITPLCQRFYRDLGIDLEALGVMHDLEVRPGKAPLAYADFVSIGRATAAGWRPARSRVSANVERGGLFTLNEIVHEDGHAVQISSIRTRPAFVGWGDDLFVEAFADVPSWSVLEPAWQRRYLGTGLDEQAALRALYANVMLDVAWGLFELRMFHDPDADPNAVWTAITSTYLNIRPHPELAWWALRVQLVDLPGYMINYGLGAVLTADLRARIRAAIGDFDAGNPQWYRYTSRNLLRFGVSVDTPELLRRFLGRPVSSAALIAQLDRIHPQPASSIGHRPR